MPKVPPEWDAYLRLQERLSQKFTVDQYAWGLEAGLHAALSDVASEDKIGRTIRSECRRERYRAKLRLTYLERQPATSPVSVANLDAQQAIQRLKAALGAGNWLLISGLAEGHDYQFLSVALGTAPGTLRVRALRLRRRLAELNRVHRFQLSKAS